MPRDGQLGAWIDDGRYERVQGKLLPTRIVKVVGSRSQQKKEGKRRTRRPWPFIMYMSVRLPPDDHHSAPLFYALLLRLSPLQRHLVVYLHWIGAPPPGTVASLVLASPELARHDLTALLLPYGRWSHIKNAKFQNSWPLKLDLKPFRSCVVS